MKYDIIYTYIAEFTGKDSRKKAKKGFVFVAKVSSQALPQAGDKLFFNIYGDKKEESVLVESVEHRLVKGIVYHTVHLEAEKSIDHPDQDWNMDDEDRWVKEELTHFLKPHKFTFSHTVVIDMAVE